MTTRRWPEVGLGDCCDIISGATPSTSDESLWGGDIDWATPKDLSDLDGLYISETPRRLSEAGLRSCSAAVLPPRSVLFSSRAPIGHVAINTVPMATNQGFKSFVPKPGVVHAEYLAYWLRSNRAYLDSLGNGATFKELSKATVERVTIPLPPIEEQRRIAAILDKADELRAKRRAALAQLDTLTEAIFIDMFGDPVSNPMDFAIKCMGDLVEKIGSGATPTGGSAAYLASGVPLIRSMNVHDLTFEWHGLVFLSDSQAKKLDNVEVNTDDVLVNITGASVARTCVVPESLTGARVNQHVAIVRPRPGELDALFLASLLVMPSIKNRLLGIGSSGATRQALTKSQLEDFQIVAPPIALQRRFSDLMGSMMDCRRKAELHLSGLTDVFESLQDRVFSGAL